MEFPDSPYSQPLRLTYSLHSKTMMESIQSCQRRLTYTDVELISEGGIVFAHSIVLAGASNYLKQLLINNPDPTIVIHLPGVDYEPLRLLLEVLYGSEELQLTLKQVVALQDLGSLLHIDMCNSAAMEQAFLQASQEGVLSIPGQLQQLQTEVLSYSNESTPVQTPQPPVQNEIPTRRSAARHSKPIPPPSNNNNNNHVAVTNSGKKRKSGGVQNSPAQVAPFSLLANVSTNRSAGQKRPFNEEVNLEEDEDEPDLKPAQPPKKLSRAAQKETVTCRECHQPFKLIVQMNHHMHRLGHLFPNCPECNIVHDTLESLIAHVDVHSSDTIFTCKYCQKGVLGHDRYLYHMLMCKSLIRGDYVCFICRKSFRNSGSLKTHLLLHTGAKPFPCNYCSASFRQRHHRSHHERSVHLMQGLNNSNNAEADEVETMPTAPAAAATTVATDGSRPFPCGFCNAAFRQSNHRSYHERVIHGVDRRTRQPRGEAIVPARSSSPSTTNNVSGSARKTIAPSTKVGNGMVAIEPDDDEEIIEEEEIELGSVSSELDVEQNADGGWIEAEEEELDEELDQDNSAANDSEDEEVE